MSTAVKEATIGALRRYKKLVILTPTESGFLLTLEGRDPIPVHDELALPLKVFREGVAIHADLLALALEHSL
ncbi:MAG TPA: hypothetical protein VJJ47_03650 [Candidatus Paceibacterota bacterium]